MSRILVVVPGVDLGKQWVTEAERHAPWLRIHFAGLDGNAPCAATKLAEFDVEVTSPGLLKNYLDGYLAKRFEGVVVDEIGELRSGGKEWQALAQVCDQASRVWAGSATLVQNDPQEVWHCLRLIAGPSFMTLAEFNDRFTTFTAGGWNRWQQRYEDPKPNGCKDTDGLGELIAQYVDLLTVEDTGLSLPTVERETVWIPVSPAHRARHASAPTMKAKEQIAGFSGEESVVTDVLLEYLLSESGHKIVFSEYKPLLDHVTARLGEAGVTTFVMHGKIPPKKRPALLADWTAAENAVLLGTKVVEVGLNLQLSSRLYSLGSSWNHAREIQREGRIRRIGSTFDTVRHTYLIADLDVERARSKTTARKNMTADLIMESARLHSF